MSNAFWKETRALMREAEKASGGDSLAAYVTAYHALKKHIDAHSPGPPLNVSRRPRPKHS